MPSNHLILHHPLLLPPSIFPSIRVFSDKSVLCIRWPKYWSFSFSISPSNEYSGLISFRMDWLDFVAVQGTLKSLLQHHSLKASVLQRSAFLIVELSHPHMTTGKTISVNVSSHQSAGDTGSTRNREAISVSVWLVPCRRKSCCAGRPVWLATLIPASESACRVTVRPEGTSEMQANGSVTGNT